MTERANIPVPDQLAGIREQIRTLETHERELREALIANPDIRTGNNWVAEVKTVTTERTDIREMRAMHPDLVAEFTFPADSVRVVLCGISEDGELVSARRMRSAEKSGDTQ